MAEGESSVLLTVREVADALRVSTMTVYRLIRAGDLASMRVGKGYRIGSADLDRYLARSRPGAHSGSHPRAHPRSHRPGE